MSAPPSALHIASPSVLPAISVDILAGYSAPGNDSLTILISGWASMNLGIDISYSLSSCAPIRAWNRTSVALAAPAAGAAAAPAAVGAAAGAAVPPHDTSNEPPAVPAAAAAIARKNDRRDTFSAMVIPSY